MSSGQVKGGITVEDEEIIRLYWKRSEDAVTATVYGEARFFLDLEPMDVVSVTQEKGR